MDYRSELELLVKLLSPNRISNISSYQCIAECIRNIGTQYYDIWLKFNRRHPEKYNKNICDKIWAYEKKTNCGLYTLHQMAKTDSLSKYANSMRKIKNVLIKACVNDFEPSNISKLFAFKYEHRFKCASSRLSIWYEFINHRWVKINTTYILRKLIATDIIEDFKNYQNDLMDKINNPETSSNYYIDTVADIDNFIFKLNSFMFQTKIVKELADNDRFFDPFFSTKLNENKYLMGFTNGVFDSNKKIFRDGCPDDYISLSTGYDYQKVKNDSIMDFFEYMNNYQFDEIDDLLKLINDCVVGHTQSLKLNILCEKNSHNNASKLSELSELIKYLFGDYFELVNGAFFANGNINYLKYSKGKKICYVKSSSHTDIQPVIFADFAKKSNLNFEPRFIFLTDCNTITEKITQEIDYVNIIEYERTEEDKLDSDEKLKHWAPILMSLIVSNHLKKK